MEINLEWLSDFIEVPPKADMCERLAAAGIEVDEVRDPLDGISGVIVAQIESAAPHPSADRLQVCVVFDGSTRHQVVCGAPNAAAGLKVAYAPVGATLPMGTITPREIRGVESFGMLCAKEELGLSGKTQGIWELPHDAVLGESLMGRLLEQSPGATLVLGLTPNRPDLLSHLGVAREVAASTGKRLKPVKWRVVEKGPDIGTFARVVVEDPHACKRYCARVVRGVRVGPSPAWLVRRLEAIGQRSINNVVDVTNYVLHELGQPLHAFDLAKLAVESGCATVRVRDGRAGETLRTLDDVTRQIEPGDIVIADANGPVAVAGVMGGADTEVTQATTAVLIESAYFDPLRVRRTAKRLGLHTEASRRFERGADPAMAARAVDRCAQLLCDVAQGDAAKGMLDVSQKWDVPREIALRLERLSSLIGIDLAAETVVQLLDPLEIRCVARNETSLRFQAPSFRPDLSREVDLIEEVVRRYGYDHVPERLPDTSGPYSYQPVLRSPSDAVRRALLASGCCEAVNYGFGSPAHCGLFAEHLGGDGQVVRIINPLGEEMSAMRTSLIPGLLVSLSRNQRHGQKHIRLFEVGTTFHGRAPQVQTDANARDAQLPLECRRVAIAIFGGRFAGHWYERDQRVDFSDLRGIVENLVQTVRPGGALAMHPNTRLGLNGLCAAEVFLSDRIIGFAGQVHPDVLDLFDVMGPVYVAELSLDHIAEVECPPIVHRALPKYPGTRRDVAVVAPKNLPAEKIRAFVQANAGGELGAQIVSDVRLFDVYEGKPIPKTHVSLAFAIEYRSRDRTLTDEEVAPAFEGLLQKVRGEFGVEVRG